jgi:transposase
MAHDRLDRRPSPSTRRWSKKSTAEDEALGRSRGGFSTKLHAAVDALGNPLGFTLTPGQRADITQAEVLVAPFVAEAVIADKGYDSDAFIAFVKAREAEAVIPSKRNRKEQREIDRNLYKDRNKVERFFNRLKHYRRLATRYEKTARNYLSMVYLASTMIWLL